ncbi:MAG: DUF4412 domain-containing protein [Acidobacteriota bacterium]
MRQFMNQRSLVIVPFLALALATLAAPAAADVTIVADTKVDGLGQSGDGETITKISGMKSRTEADIGRNSSITLMDLDAKQMVVLNERRKRAEVFDMNAAAQQQVALQTHEVMLEANGNKREIAGYACEDHDLKARIEAGMEGMELEVVMSGVVCLSQDAPGKDEWAAFNQAMAERGLFFGNPEAAQAQPGRERGMTEMYRKMSEKGIALASDLNIGFEGDGPMAAMMGRMKFETSTTVKSISTEAVPASEFSPPAGYKVKNK